MAQEFKIIEPLTSFGELSVAEIEPICQVNASYGVRSKTDTEVFTDGSTGSVSLYEATNGGRELKMTTGTAVGGYAIVRTKRAVKYRAGQGLLSRFTARFEVPPKLGGARAGLIGIGTELSFGYDSNQRFGILYRTAGKQQIVDMTISAAPTGNETLTITLNGVPFTANVTSGTTSHAGFQIGATAFSGWTVKVMANKVTFSADAVGAKSGVYSITSTGTTAGSFVTVQTGSAVQDTWTYQEDWNLQPAFRLDPKKGNVYQIQLQYLGYGAITFSIENIGSGNFVPVHIIKYANANSGPSLALPIFKPSVAAFSLGSSTSFSAYMGSMAGFIEGKANAARNPWARSNSKANVGTSLTNILSLRNDLVFNSTTNSNEIFPHFLNVAIEGTKPAEVQLILNPVLGGEPVWVDQDTDNSFSEYDVTGTTATIGANSQILFASAISKSGQISINLADLHIVMTRLDVLTIAVAASTATVDVSAAITWIED